MGSNIEWATLHIDNLDDLFEEAKHGKKFSKLYYVSQGRKLKFVVDAGSSSSLLKNLILYSNYPSSSSPFDRNHFVPLKPKTEYDGLNDWVVEFSEPIRHSGFFEYYFECLSEGERLISARRSFNVEPQLKRSNQILPAESLVVQTALTKCLGTLEEWPKHFKESAELEYNMIHFTPIQELGFSGSAYSLYDQMSVGSSMFVAKKHGDQVEEEYAPYGYGPKRGVLNPSNLPHKEREQKLKATLDKLEKEMGLLSMTDVVLNHTANNSPWLAEHPEAGYNVNNSPHLRPAVDLDDALMIFSQEVYNGVYNDIPKTGNYSEDQVRHLLHVFKTRVWPLHRMWEYYVVDVNSTLSHFRKHLEASQSFTSEPSLPFNELLHALERGIREDGHCARFSRKLDLNLAFSLLSGTSTNPRTFEASEVESRVQLLKSLLDAYNTPLYEWYDRDSNQIEQNLFHRVNRGPLTLERPLIDNYFTRIVSKSGEKIALANNGWIWNGNPLVNFAGPESRAYYMREVIVWGDCVKLRYGDSPQDSPWLWDHMTKYCEWSAQLFHGLRIDNAHSTPIHVAQTFLDAARRVRPELFVIAELFTGSSELDEHFVASWGINALIREAMSANDSWDLGRYIHRYGGKPVASVSWNTVNLREERVKNSAPLSILIDCTHDNETPVQKRTAADSLSTFGLVSMSVSAIGSTTGYDQIVKSTIDVVKEHRRYSSMRRNPVQNGSSKDANQGEWKGIGKVKQILNKLHAEMALEGYEEVHVHQEEDLINVQRHNPRDHRAVFMVAHCAFNRHSNPLSPYALNVKIPAKITELILGARISVFSDSNTEGDEIRGLDSHLDFTTTDMSLFGDIHESKDPHTGTWMTYLVLKNFHPGSILAFRAEPFPLQKAALGSIRNTLENEANLTAILKNLDLVDLNALLYRCKEEEETVEKSAGVFNVPNFGTLKYGGIASFDWLLEKIRRGNDMGHPFFDQLRQGNWALDYLVDRLTPFPTLSPVQKWLREVFEPVKSIPRFLIPKYFDLVVSKLYRASVTRSLSSMSNLVAFKDSRDPISFPQKLALGSVQLYGRVKNAPLLVGTNKPSLAAGLPHFSSGYMRAWGRDTFISLRGLLLVTGRHAEARDIILTCAGFVRHGLVPNLLDGGQSPRYNARDATWWFLQAVQDYCGLASEGTAILSAKVTRRFPTDNQEEHERNLASATATVENTLSQVIQEILQKHAQGISFREWNAGTRIDAHMRDEGFNIRVYVDWHSNGFVFGGNRWNCGTWMDKMGESAKAGSKGFPATPRDGADVEIIGLLKSTLRWLTSLSKNGDSNLSFKGVNNGTRFITFAEWNDLIQKSFENFFYVPKDPSLDDNYRVSKPHVHRRGMYRDTVGSVEEWADYQLRPNFPVAMAVAPELFDPQHAREALETVEKVLVGPLGMATLDPADFNYEAYYDMSNDSEERRIAKGFNYHQGPEWVWVIGYFLRAKALFSSHNRNTTRHQISKIMLEHKKHIDESPWRGIHELTNKAGSECHFSCPTQAWSLSCLLDTIYDLESKK
eukprot:TRINITY_DN2573_c0_g1_i1.p1 TRINITY_DN2573_c0_g1~~TRINITY_DN2573_c0_g1_i1.p1  ORF type:complete len:1537 (+),score=521.58 TRINITY_DN2573_c0_g1_i1:125-4735(+)